MALIVTSTTVNKKLESKFDMKNRIRLIVSTSLSMMEFLM